LSTLTDQFNRARGWWLALFNRVAHSYLVWALVALITLLWVLHVEDIRVDYKNRMEQQVVDFQQRQLRIKSEELQDVFRAIYQHVRIISLIPAIRAVEGGNRSSEDEDVVAMGRLSVDTHETVRQIYTNLSHNIKLSEIYYVIEGFRPDLGEVPFFMYDNEIALTNNPDFVHLPPNADYPEESEDQEYAYYQVQNRWFNTHYPVWRFGDSISEIPAITSPLLRTCDNSQYGSLANGDVRNTFGLLYSVPVYDLKSNRFKGIISAVLRANVLEAILVGVPSIIVSEQERLQAEIEGWQMPEDPAEFLLVNEKHEVRIHDRRNEMLNSSMALLNSNGGRVAGSELRINSDSVWRLHHYLSPKQIDALNSELRSAMHSAVGGRIALLLVLLAILWRAIRDQRIHHSELVRLAHYDTLTELPNRTLFVKRLDQSISRSRRHLRHLGLMFIDIDNFRSINDALGQRIGDAILIEIAKRLESVTRASDEVLRGTGRVNEEPLVLARMGGDDFTLIFDELAAAEEGVLVGERVIELFRKPVVMGEHVVDISISAGMAIYPEDAHTADELMACADFALRHATQFGSGRFEMFNDDMRRRAAHQTRLMRELQVAVRDSCFELYYQPKQALDSNHIVSFEALLRWNHPDMGMISPVDFIPLLEQSGQIVDVGRWVLETACRQLVEWHQNGLDGLSVSVNVSPRQMLLSDLVLTVDTILAQTGLDPARLILEITESTMIDNIQEGSATLERLRKRGVRLAIDDFGTGYSSMTYLRGLPMDYLKLDKSMIDSIFELKGGHVVKSTIDLAHGLDLITVAEGVEEEPQRERLREMGCDLIQGYFLSRPLPLSEVLPFLGGHKVGV
jgi:diguanylate cyclase (GGDEF)-like protein